MQCGTGQAGKIDIYQLLIKTKRIFSAIYENVIQMYVDI
jgi:hypothetical protein